MELPQLLPAQPECKLCVLHSLGCKSVGIPTVHLPWSRPSSGEFPACVIIGHKPGIEEDWKNEPFVGYSGNLLKEVYIKGISLHEKTAIYFSNVVRCFPGKTNPTKTHAKACLPYLEADLKSIASVHPNVYLLILGGEAAQALTGRTLQAMFRYNGEKTTVLSTPCTVVATYHTAALDKNPNYIKAAHDHLQILSDRLEGRSLSRSLPHFVPPRYAPRTV